MNCLLVAATHFEIAPFLETYRASPLFRDREIDILVTGIGLTAASYAITKQVHLKRPGCIIQAGIAGCFDKNIPLSTVVAVKQETIADQAVTEKKKLRTLFDLQLVSPNQFPFSNGWLVNRDELLKKVSLKKVKGISVNEISTSPQKIKQYKMLFNPITESMEGAAMHYVALMENIPFLQLRAISNYIGERNKKNWALKESIQNLNITLTQLLQQP